MEKMKKVTKKTKKVTKKTKKCEVSFHFIKKIKAVKKMHGARRKKTFTRCYADVILYIINYYFISHLDFVHFYC